MSAFEFINGEYALELSLDEAHILINLAEQLLELLGEGDFSHHYTSDDPFAQIMSSLGGEHFGSEVAPPEDDVLKRLLPNAYADPESSADFRRYTEQAIRSKKIEILRQIRGELSPIVDSDKPGQITDLDADTWLLGINDLHLALAVRLDVDENSFELFESLSDEDPQKAIFAVYFWLGWLQESLLRLLDPRS